MPEAQNTAAAVTKKSQPSSKAAQHNHQLLGVGALFVLLLLIPLAMITAYCKSDCSGAMKAVANHIVRG